MALAEARAAWQRTANRCLVQEDAKRAPKLACCSSAPPPVKNAETGPTGPPGGQDIPTTGPLPFNRSPSYSNLSPNSRWWLQLQPHYGYQKGLTDDQQFAGELARNKYDPGPNDNQCRTETKDFGDNDEIFGGGCNWDFQDSRKLRAKEDFEGVRDGGYFSCEVSKNGHDVYFDSKSSWIGGEKNTPWWRIANTEELALLVSQRSLEFVENCDLPSPQNARVKRKLNVDMCCFSPDKTYSSSLDGGFGARSPHDSCTYDSVPSGLGAGSSCQTLRMSAERNLATGANKLLSESPTHVRMPRMPSLEDDKSKAQLLEALRHSQTRARQAEKVAKQAYTETQHVLKLILKQASQLFAYKQWFQLLQLENNMYFQFKNNKSSIQSSAPVVPVVLPWMPLKTRKARKGWQKSWGRKRAKRSHPRYDVDRYAVIFALGLGLVGAGLLLGWTIGWMLPTW